MRHVVIDTNCLVQMISRHSPFWPVWDAFRKGQYVLCVSNEIISEYAEILSLLTTPFIAENIVNAILKSPFCLRCDPQFHFELIKQDSDDNKFVDCAIIANADCIVSDDRHFDALKRTPFPQVRVIRLEQFLQHYQTPEGNRS